MMRVDVVHGRDNISKDLPIPTPNAKILTYNPTGKMAPLPCKQVKHTCIFSGSISYWFGELERGRR